MRPQPPEVFETRHPPYVACVTCSFLMAYWIWTDGLLSHAIPEYPDFEPVIKRLRAGIPANQGTAPGAARAAFGKEFPQWPLVNADLFTPMGTVLALLDMDYVFVLIGNPSHVQDPGSPLRRWQGGTDDYDHAIYVGDVQGDKAWVQDPLSPVGPYRGQWVSALDLAQFASRFQQPGGVECVMFERGGALKELSAVDLSENFDLFVPKGTPYYESPTATSKVLARETGVPGTAREYGVIKGGWLQARVNTAAISGTPGIYFLFVDPKAKGLTKPPKTIPTPITQAQLDAAILKAQTDQKALDAAAIKTAQDTATAAGKKVSEIVAKVAGAATNIVTAETNIGSAKAALAEVTAP